MIVKVEMKIDTDDYGEEEFKKEIEKLIEDIDPNAILLEFEMYEIEDPYP